MIPTANKDASRPPSRSSSMRPPPPRFSLMTPSASPPVQRPLGRNLDGPSPTKRQRMMSETPALASSGSSSGTRSRSLGPSSFSLPSPALSIEHTTDHVEDLHSARRASSFKVLHVWSQLAEKYAKPLDQDDIVDLENETIIKDYGVLRSSNNVWDIGCFADDHENERQQLASEDEPDELDAFAETASRSETDGEEDDLELARQQLRLPPVRELDPADAADLAEFMEAERRRKELFGDIDEESDRRSTASRSEVDFGEEDDEEGTQGEDQGEEDEEGECEDYYEVYEDCEVGLRDEDNGKHFRAEAVDRSGSVLSGSPEIDFIDLSTADSDESEGGGDRREDDNDDLDFSSDHVENSIIREEDADSDDELGGWEQDEGTVVYELAEPEIVEIEDADVDADAEYDIDSHVHTLTSPQDTVVETRPSKRQTTKGSTVVPRKPSLKAKKTGKKIKESSFASTTANPEPVQLNTPPRSSSFGPELHKSKDTSTHPRQRLKKSPLRKSLRRTSPPASECTSSEHEDSIAGFEKSSKRQVHDFSKTDSVSSSRTSRHLPEVYIDVPPPKLKATPTSITTKQRQSGRDYFNSDSDGHRAEFLITQKNWKGKEKALDFVKSGSTWKIPHESPATSAKRSSASSSSRTSGESQNITSSYPSHATRKRRREPTPPHITEVDDEYVTNRNTNEDYEHQRSFSTSISPSPPLSNFPAPGRTTNSMPNNHAFENEDRYVEEEAGPSSRNRQTSQPRRHNDSFRPDSPPTVAHSRSHSRSRSHYQSSSSDDTRTPRAEGRRREQSISNTHQHPSSQAIPNLQAPEAQFHLAKIAQNLQNLTALLGGTLGNGLPSLSKLEDLTQSPWPPNSPRHLHTPRHHYHHQLSQTPQSVASAPPTSSPVGSDYSDQPSSSPIKYSTRERGRSKSIIEQASPRRPKSAIRDRNRSSRTRTISRRVSFSSPEAVNIDESYVRQSSDLEESDSVNDGLRHRRKYHDRSEKGYPYSDDIVDSNRVTMRAQTPGPPGDYQDSQRAVSRPRTVEDHPARDDRPRRPRTPSLHREREYYR